MKIHEVIQFSHELDMLEAHLDEHQNFVDKFFVKESAVWFSGTTKPLYLTDNLSRFKRFNLEVIVIPADEFITNIPSSIKDEEYRKWFQVRRNNRNKSRMYDWNHIKDGADYVFSTDTDEIIHRDLFSTLEDIMNGKEHKYIAITMKNHCYYVNSLGKRLRLYRVFREDVEYDDTFIEDLKKDNSKIITPLVGGHFHNCFIDPSDLHKKYIGISTHIGFSGISDIPSVGCIKASLEKGYNPSLTKWKDGEIVEPVEILVKNFFSKEEAESWVPRFMLENPEKFPWYEG
jgi:hypothetical protein